MGGQKRAEGRKDRRSDPRPEHVNPARCHDLVCRRPAPLCELRHSNDPAKEATGSRHEPGVVRQTAPVEGESIVPQTQKLMGGNTPARETSLPL